MIDCPIGRFSTPFCFTVITVSAVSLAVGGPGCNGPTPSDKLRERIALPTPAAKSTLPQQDRLAAQDRGERHVLTPINLISIAFNLQPDIKSSYQRFKSEEGLYDFYYTSRDSLTPKLSLANTWAEQERFEKETDERYVKRSRDHETTMSMEKRFFDTTEMDVGMGYDVNDHNVDGYGKYPFVTGRMRYPLWGSRQRLERTSEEIFRRNALNDAQLAFIQTARARLNAALNRYYSAIYYACLRDNARRWHQDLQKLLSVLEGIAARDVSADKRRIEAEVASVESRDRDFTSQAEVQNSRLKADCGLSFHAQVELVNEPFDPFGEMTHEQLLKQGLDTDPEIATLKNAMSNAQVQLDLARRGKWDVALLADGRTNLAGGGTYEGDSDWRITLGMEVSAVDHRVTGSLIRQAQADIERFREAIASRENAIFVDTLEPLVRNESLGKSKEALIENLSKYEEDFKYGIQEYTEGSLSIDDLLSRREKIFSQEQEIATQALYMGYNVSALCAATGKFFELLNGHGEPAAALDAASSENS